MKKILFSLIMAMASAIAISQVSIYRKGSVDFSLESGVLDSIYLAKDELHYLNVSSYFESGTVTGSGYYLDSTIVTISATPNKGYKFLKWSGGNTEYSRKVLVTQNSYVIAYFIPDYKDGTENGHEYVDLGLTSGTLWATCNVGAANPTEAGDYYAWGETTPQADKAYKWAIYKFGLMDSLTKYCTHPSYGVVDNKTELEKEDDAATVNWGDKWRMPTREQLQELISECYIVKTSHIYGSQSGYIFFKAKTDADKGVVVSDSAYNVSKYKQYTPLDAHIFLPEVTNRRNSISYDEFGGDETICWSSSLSDETCAATILDYEITRESFETNGFQRCYGLPVRAVFVSTE